MLLSLTDTVNMKLVEVFEAFVMYGHILHLETSSDEIVSSPSPCFIIVKEGKDMGQVLIVQIANCPCHIAHGVHHKAVAGYLLFH